MRERPAGEGWCLRPSSSGRALAVFSFPPLSLARPSPGRGDRRGQAGTAEPRASGGACHSVREPGCCCRGVSWWLQQVQLLSQRARPQSRAPGVPSSTGPGAAFVAPPQPCAVVGRSPRGGSRSPARPRSRAGPGAEVRKTRSGTHCRGRPDSGRGAEPLGVRVARVATPGSPQSPVLTCTELEGFAFRSSGSPRAGQPRAALPHPAVPSPSPPRPARR